MRDLPTDWMYTWHVFDSLNLLRFTCAQLGRDQRASSDETPPPTSHGRNTQQYSEGNKNQRDMVDSVKDIGVSIADMSRATKMRRVDQLRLERHRVSLEKTRTTVAAEEEVHDIYINELSAQIANAENELN